jgi:hypothetical protein
LRAAVLADIDIIFAVLRCVLTNEIWSGAKTNPNPSTPFGGEDDRPLPSRQQLSEPLWSKRPSFRHGGEFLNRKSLPHFKNMQPESRNVRRLRTNVSHKLMNIKHL